MADTQDNEEYQISDMGGAQPVTNEGAVPPEENDLASTAVKFFQRNALMAVGIVLALIFIYKFMGLFTSPHKSASSKMEALTPIQQPIQPAAPASSQSPSVAEVTLKPEVNQKLLALESSQQGVRGDIADMNAQLGNLQNNMQGVSSQLANLMSMIQALSQKLDAQNQAMVLLEARLTAKPKVSKPHHVKRHKVVSILYYIQAIIPGRAWLVSANGQHTVTVREGTRLPGYGVVQLIDPNQGRVLTSSGQTIKFSQQDS